MRSSYIQFICYILALQSYLLHAFQVKQWAIEIKQSATSKISLKEEADRFALENEFINLGQIGDLEGFYLFEVPVFENNYNQFEDHHFEKREFNGILLKNLKKRTLSNINDELDNNLYVNWFQLQEPKKRKKRFIPYDAAYFNDPLYSQQWYLYNDGNFGHHKGNDINVLPLWKRGINGTGVTVSIIDDGVDFKHPDLIDSFSLEGSFDFTKRKADPTPDEKEDTHGTRCAGEIAGKGNNGICGVGVAFGAKISGEKLIANITIDATEAAAFNFQNQLNHIYSASWGPNDDGETLDGPGVLGKKALKQGTVTGRDGLGSIFVFASGNGGKEGDNCNSDGYQNSIYTISIGAITASGVIPWYGEQCSAHLAVTYSGGEGLGVSTTDLDNGCSSKHSGTSAAAPIAAGIIALVLSVRNDLSWRDIQQLIVKTAKITDFKDSDWIKNGAGFHVSHKYGFGNLDATRMVEEALNHSTLPKESLQFEKHKFANRNIEYKELEGGFFDELIISKEEIENIGLVSLEHVQVTVKIMHEDRGHLKITLVSPAGTPSIVYNQRPKDHSSDGFDNWTFLTVRNWGENPIGKWVMKVEDFRLGSINTKTGLPNLPGHLYSWGIVLYGTCSKEDETSYVINSSFLGKSRIEKKCIHTVKIEEDGRQETIIGLIILMLFVIIGVSSYTFRKIFKSNFKYRLTPKEDIESPRKTSFKENFGRERNKESESDEEDSEYDDEIDEKKKKKTYKNNFTPKLLNLNISQLFTTNSNTSNRRLVNTKADEQENTSVPLISPVKQLIPEHKEFLMSNVGTGKTNSNLLVTGKEMESGNSEIAGEGEFSHTSALNKHFYANSPTLRRQNSAVRPLNSFNQEDGNRLEKEIKLVKVNSLQCLGDGLKGEVKRVNSTTGMHLKGISRSQSGSNLKNIKNN